LRSGEVKEVVEDVRARFAATIYAGKRSIN
jgi:hypothetical protein